MSILSQDGQTLITDVFRPSKSLQKSVKKRKQKTTVTNEKRKKKNNPKKSSVSTDEHTVNNNNNDDASSSSSKTDDDDDGDTEKQKSNVTKKKRKMDALEERPQEINEEEEEETSTENIEIEGEDIEDSEEDNHGPKTRSKTSKKKTKKSTPIEQAEKFNLKRHVTFSSLPVLLAPIIRDEKEILFNDDEFFTLDDNIVRRIIYRQIPSKELFHNIKRITMFNFTGSQFECTGATRWEHLKTHYWDLFSSVCDSLGYATGKKTRNIPASKVAPNSNKKRRVDPSQPIDTDAVVDDVSVVTNRSGVSGAETEAIEGEEQPIEKESQFLQGNSDITVICEPLLSHNSRCAGFRIWIFDKGVPKNESDHFSLGLKESLHESATIADMATRQAAFAIKASMPRGTKGVKPSTKEYQILREFNYTKHPTFDRHFMNITRRYFTTDPCFVLDEEQAKLIDDIEPENANHLKFRDSRPFVNYDAMGFNTRVNLFESQNHPAAASAVPTTKDYSSRNHPCNVTKLFDKVAGMHYYVLDAGIHKIQCQLSSYFKGASTLAVFNSEGVNESEHININIYDMGREDEERMDEEGLPQRVEEEEIEKPKSKKKKGPSSSSSSLLDVGVQCNVPDSAFESFPYENITYQIDNIFISRELMCRMPLPHRIGSTLYTGKDERSLHELAGISDSNDLQQQEQQQQQQHEDMDQWFDEGNENNKERDSVVMGLHDCEYELTTETLLSQLYHLDERSASLLKYPIIPKSVLKKFTFNKTNEVNTRLKLIMSCLGPKGRVVIGESPFDSSGNMKKKINRVELPDSHTNLLNINAHRPPLFANTITSLSLTDYSHALQTLQEPYISYTEPGFINNISKKTPIRRKALEYRRRNDTLNDNDREQLKEYALREYQNKVASGNIGHFKEIIEKYRPFGNSLDVIKTKLHNVRTEEIFLSRDIFLRLAELNKEAFKNLKAAFFDLETGRVRIGSEEAYHEERGRLVDALVVECWDEFFKNPHVSMAVEGVRNDLLKQHMPYRPPSNDVSQTSVNNSPLGKKTIGRPLPVYQFRHDLRPYSAFRIYIHSFLSDQGGITYNYKTASILYFSKLHHCRWFPQCNNPKLNIILSGSGMAGKSKMLQLIKETCPSSVGDMVTHITDQAFNIDRNLNDMLLIYEEFQNKYLGYTPNGNSGKNSGGNGGGTSGGVSSGDSKDTTNFFKARLTGGKTATFSWFKNEETDLRDMKISQAHCQGNLLAATNNDLSEADLNVLSRLILISVPKSKHAIDGLRPQDRDKMTYGQSSDHDDEMYEEHKEIHRVYVLMEQIFKSYAIGDDVFGVNVDSARIQLLHILDQLQYKYGIPTNDVRKRNHVLELSRCMNLSFSIWTGLTSTLTRHLQYSPHNPELEPEEKKTDDMDEPRWIGFNPRVITEGILPFCNVTTDQVIDAATSLSCLWYHEYQNLILEVFSTKKCKLQELKESDFLWRKKPGFHHTTSSDNNRASGYAVNSMQEGSNSGYGNLSRSGGYGTTNASTQAFEHPKEIDYNYIKFSGKNSLEIAREISLDLGELVVAPADILKLLTDLSRSRIDDIDGYEMDLNHVDEKGRTRAKLIKSTDIRKKKHRYVVDMSYCQTTQRPTISILVHFLKHELPHIFTDDIIENLEEKKKDNDNEEEEVEREILQEEEEEEETVDPEEEEEDVDRYYKSIREIGKIGKRTESLITKAIKDIVQHPAYGFTGLSKEKEEELRDSYRNPLTGNVPWDSFVTADPPKPVKLTEFYPDLKPRIGKTKTGDRDILFPDRLLMLNLKRNKKAPKLIIQNHNVVSSSTRNSLSIYDNIVDQSSSSSSSSKNHSRPGERRELTRNRRIEEYMDTDAWELDMDLDFITANEHLRNIGFRGLKTAKNYTTINYPPSTYMALVDHKRRIDAAELGKPLDDEEVQKPLLEYPFYDNIKRVEARKRKIEGELNPTKVKYAKFSPFVASNFAETSEIYKRSNVGELIVIGKPVKRSIEKEKAFLKKQYESALFKSF